MRLDEPPPPAPRAEPAAPPPAPVLPPTPVLPISPAADALIDMESIESGLDLESPGSGPIELAEDAHPVDPVEVHARPAGLFARAVALGIDALVIGALLAGFLIAARLIVGPRPSDELEVSAWRALLVPGVALCAALAFVYSTLFHTLGGRTLGKRLLGLVLLDATGRPPRLARSAMRTLLVPLSFAPLFLGVLMALAGRNKQSLHDRLTGTYVVRLGR